MIDACSSLILLSASKTHFVPSGWKPMPVRITSGRWAVVTHDLYNSTIPYYAARAVRIAWQQRGSFVARGPTCKEGDRRRSPSQPRVWRSLRSDVGLASERRWKRTNGERRNGRLPRGNALPSGQGRKDRWGLPLQLAGCDVSLIAYPTPRTVRIKPVRPVASLTFRRIR